MNHDRRDFPSDHPGTTVVNNQVDKDNNLDHSLAEDYDGRELYSAKSKYGVEFKKQQVCEGWYLGGLLVLSLLLMVAGGLGALDFRNFILLYFGGSCASSAKILFPGFGRTTWRNSLWCQVVVPCGSKRLMARRQKTVANFITMDFVGYDNRHLGANGRRFLPFCDR